MKKEGNKDVLAFIDRFLDMQKSDHAAEALRVQFHNGYCYYFALMLQTAFQRGTVCWAAPLGHIVWMDDEAHGSVPYDIEGVNESECECYIPVSEMGKSILDFMHVPGKTHDTTDQEIARIMLSWKEKEDDKIHAA